MGQKTPVRAIIGNTVAVSIIKAMISSWASDDINKPKDAPANLEKITIRYNFFQSIGWYCLLLN